MSEAATNRERVDVAVLVPSYNHANYVEHCLRSVFNQTLPPSHLLVIDDGSSDGSVPVIERTLADSPFPAELIVRENRGLCATLNQGLARTSGRYFAYLGSDDLWTSRRLELGVERLERSPAAVLAYGDCYTVDSDGAVIGSTRDWQSCRDGAILLDLLRGESVPRSPTVLYRRSCLEQVGWNESAQLEDYETYVRLAVVGPFAYIAEYLGYWRKHENNTSKDTEMMLREIERVHKYAAATTGISSAELRAAEHAVKFTFAGNLLDAGEKKRSWQLTLASLRGAGSTSAIARRLLKLLAPNPVLRVWRQVQTSRARKIYSGETAFSGTAADQS